MASATSASAALWESVREDEAKLVPEIDIDDALMAFLEEAQVGDAEDGRLSRVIQSFEAEIESGTMRRGEFIVPNSTGGGGHGLTESYEEDSMSAYPIDDPFDWVDMEMVPGSIGNDMDQWYMNACMDELGHVDQFGDQMNYVDGFRDHGFYNVDALVEQDFIPLWEEHVWH